MNPNTQEIHGSDSQNFETLKYNIVNGSSDILVDDAYDPDLNLDTMYVSQEDVLEKPVTGDFSILHLNIQSIKKKKKIESFKKFLFCLDFTFSIMFFRDMV